MNNMNNMNSINNPPPINNNNLQQNNINQFNEPQFGKKINEPVQKEVNEIKSEPMNQDEEMVYNYFSNYIDIYNNAYRDENKRKDFANKVNALLKKLENHEIKNSLIKSLQDFINLKTQKDHNQMRRLYIRIQSIDWDKNKSWMPLLEKIINMKD